MKGHKIYVVCLGVASFALLIYAMETSNNTIKSKNLIIDSLIMENQHLNLLKVKGMCIICSDPDLGQEYLNSIDSARIGLKNAELALLKLGKKYPNKNYDKAHKKLVRIRKSINEVEETRED